MGAIENNSSVATATEETSRSYFPRWRLKKEGVISPEERLPWGTSILMGLQHVLAMFGATVVAPLAMGFDPNVAIFFSGIGTLIFFLIVGGRIPSYLGSSFAFIGVVSAATGYQASMGVNPNIPVALGGIIAAGALYAIIAIIVMIVGHRWIEKLMPPVVTGTVVMAIGLNLAAVTFQNQVAVSSFAGWMALVTVLAVCIVSVYAPGALRRLSILIGGLIGYFVHLVCGFIGLGPQIDFSKVASADWIGLPNFTAPVFSFEAITLIAPVAIILAAENIGHIKAVGAMTGKNMDKYLGRAFLGDAIATMTAGAGGGTGVTTYAENIGVMAVTRIYSTIIFIVASVVAILLGFCPKFGALIQTIPPGVLGGLSIVLFGLIAVTGGRIWSENKVDFSKNRNLFSAGIPLIIGSGMINGLVVSFGTVSIDGIGLATFSAIILYQLLRERNPQPEEGVVADAAVGKEPVESSETSEK